MKTLVRKSQKNYINEIGGLKNYVTIRNAAGEYLTCTKWLVGCWVYGRLSHEGPRPGWYALRGGLSKGS